MSLGMLIVFFTRQTLINFICVIEEIVKCSRCPIRQPRNAFPRKRNLEPLQTCHDCTKKRNSERQTKREEKESIEGSIISQKSNNPDVHGGGTEMRLSLSWTDFIGLIAKHKADAFELDAELNLSELLDGVQDPDNQDTVRKIAEKIWRTTDYRFMYV
jgi:hypothetical protein